MLFLITFSVKILITASKIAADTEHFRDVSIPLQITTQYQEMSVIVFCFDASDENSHFIKQMSENLKHNILLVNYEEKENNTQFLPESSSYFYVLSFHDVSKLKNFVTPLSQKIQVILVLSHNVLEDVNVLRVLCHFLKVYIFDLLLSKFMSCVEEIGKGITFGTVELEGRHFLELRDIFNFQGRKFKVGLTDFPLRFEYRKFDLDSEPFGSHRNILNLISKQLNFSFSLYELEGTNKYSKAVEMVQSGDVDLIAGSMFIDYNRIQHISYTRYMTVETLAIFFGRQIQTSNLLNVAVVIPALLGLVGVYVVKRIHSKIYQDFGYGSDFWIILRPLFTQPVATIKTRRGSLGFIFLIWWWFCFFYSMFFNSSLFTTLLRKDVMSNTFLGLVEQGFTFEAGVTEVGYITSNCRNVHTIECDVINNRLVGDGNICVVIERFAKEKVAYIRGEFDFQVQYKKCTNSSISDNVLTIKDPLFGIGIQGWAIRNQSLLQRPISRMIRNIDAAGILQYWIPQTNLVRQKERTISFQILKMESFYPILVLLNIGYCVAIGAFLLEILLNKIQQTS